MIEVFGFNTTNGGTFEMHNTTLEEIKAELLKRFPKWSEAVIEKIATNENYYKSVIPVDKESNKKVVKHGSIANESICINGFELKPILTLGQNVHSYHKYAYKLWSEDVNRVLSQPIISNKFNEFEKKYDEVVVAIKSSPRASDNVIKQKVIAMYNQIIVLKSAFEKSGCIQQDINKEYVNGTGKRMGLSELLKKIGEISIDNLN